jgi:copper oxidase (laccase) domain-containing protein
VARAAARACFVTTRALGDMRKGAVGRERLRALVPAEPLWLHQVHGTRVHDAHWQLFGAALEGDSFVLREPGPVCAIQAADCMPVLLADGGEVRRSCACGWRGLAAGVIEATLQRWDAAAARDRVARPGDRSASLRSRRRGARCVPRARCRGAARIRRERGRIHWLLDLYAIARQRLARAGITRVFGGTLCTYSDRSQFFSFRRDRTSERMAALAWLE